MRQENLPNYTNSECRKYKIMQQTKAESVWNESYKKYLP